jgi:hypothetical protein
VVQAAAPVEEQAILATTTAPEPAVDKPEAPRSHARKRADKPHTPRARAADDCAVPFLLDETGVRIPKRHCL